MSSDPNEQEDVPTNLDPIRSLVYYLCVTHALADGSLVIPSTNKLAQLLKPNADARVQDLRRDLRWMRDKRLLFREDPLPDEFYQRTLAQPNINKLIIHQRKPRNLGTALFFSAVCCRIASFKIKDFSYGPAATDE